MDNIKFSKARQLTPSNGFHHFFGYYSISPWNASGRYFACLETDFHDHLPKHGEKARILLLDLKEGTNRVVTETMGWNFQQGTMLHWLPSDAERKIIFNDCDDDGAFSRIVDVETGDSRRLPRPINGVAKTRDLALCVNFTRLRKFRKVTSLPVSKDYSKGGPHPDDDGIFVMDLKTGELDLIVTLDQIWKANPNTTLLDDEIFRELGEGLWFNHVVFNPSATRLHFLARFRNMFSGLVTSLWTVNTDGSDPHLLVDFYHHLSHFEWVDDENIIVTMEWPERKMHHVSIVDKQDESHWKIIAGDVLTRNGHPTVNLDKKLMATDTYIVDGKRHVYIMERDTEKVHEVHSFDNPPMYDGEIRCDPHPRWSRDGKQLSFDGLGENGRQVYILDADY